MSGDLIEWLSLTGASLFAAAAFAMGWRVVVYRVRGLPAFSLPGLIALGGLVLFSGEMLSEGAAWIVWLRVNDGIPWRQAMANTESALIVGRVLKVVGASIFLGAATYADCGHKIWLAALGVAAVLGAAFGVHW